VEWALRRSPPFLVLLVVVPLAVILAVTHHVNVTLGRRQALHNLSVTAQLAAQIVDETLKGTFLVERMLEAQPAFREAVHRQDRGQLNQLLQQLQPFIPKINFALVATTQGEVIAVYPLNPHLIGRSLAQDEGFQDAQRGGWHPYVSAVHLGAGELLEKVVEVVLPLSDEGTVIGLLQIQYRIEEVKSWLQQIRVEPGGFLYVVDHHDQLVVYPFQILPGKPKVVSDWPPVAATGTALAFRNGPRHERWLAGIHQVGATGWRVIAAQPERDVLRLLHRTLWPMGLLVAFLLLLIIIVHLQWAQSKQQRGLAESRRSHKPGT